MRRRPLDGRERTCYPLYMDHQPNLTCLSRGMPRDNVFPMAGIGPAAGLFPLVRRSLAEELVSFCLVRVYILSCSYPVLTCLCHPTVSQAKAE